VNHEGREAYEENPKTINGLKTFVNFVVINTIGGSAAPAMTREDGA